MYSAPPQEPPSKAKPLGKTSLFELPETAPLPRKLLLARRRGLLLISGHLLLFLLVFLAGVGIGAVDIQPAEVLAILLDQVGIDTGVDFTQLQENVLIEIRMPRVILGMLIGAALAVSGAAVQGLFRNPLADPALIGISSGAAFTAALMIVFGALITESIGDLLGLSLASVETLQQWALPIAAFFGGVITTLLIYRLATANGVTSVATMLLAGIAINALATAGVGMLIFQADDDQLRDIAFWNLGSLGLADWDMVLTVTPFVIITVLPLLLMARPLNALLLGETEAEHLGHNVERVKRVIIIMVALAVGAGVAFAGVIGFVGLIVPHLIRLTAGPDHRYVLPGSMIAGASLLVAADLLARTIAVPREIPIGIVTALVGAPFFLYLLLRDRSRGGVL